MSKVKTTGYIHRHCLYFNIPSNCRYLYKKEYYLCIGHLFGICVKFSTLISKKFHLNSGLRPPFSSKVLLTFLSLSCITVFLPSLLPSHLLLFSPLLLLLEDPSNIGVVIYILGNELQWAVLYFIVSLFESCVFKWNSSHAKVLKVTMKKLLFLWYVVFFRHYIICAFWLYDE